MKVVKAALALSSKEDLWPQQSHCLATKQKVYDFSKAEKREDPDAPIVRSRKGS